jgi:hypothetical protein
VLDAFEYGNPDPFSVSILTSDYLTIATTLQQEGYEIQNLSIYSDTASVQVTTSSGPDLIPMNLKFSQGKWIIQP